MTLQGLFLLSSVIILFLMNLGYLFKTKDLEAMLKVELKKNLDYLFENHALKEQLKEKQKRTKRRSK